MAVNGISGFNAISPATYTINKTGTGEEQKTSFSEYLKNGLENVNALQIESDNYTNALAAGKTDNIHQVMIAAEKADIALQFTMQIRNKILDAYNEIMRIQI